MSDSYLKRLVNTFETKRDKVAMRVVGDDSEVYTFGQSLSLIRSIAYRLGQENVGRGDRVALIGENHPCWAIAYLGTLYHGAVCVPLDPHGEIGCCIGSESKFDQLDSALVKNLIAAGRIRCDDLRFGLDATPDGQLRDADGKPSELLYTLGTALKGILWESTAIPEIRVQARDLAQKLVNE